METFAQALCFFCVAIGSPPTPQLPQRAGDIWYTHEMPARGVHLLRLGTTDLILDWNRYRADRLNSFAHQFAEQTCRGPFTLVAATRTSWPHVRPVYAKQYIFRC